MNYALFKIINGMAGKDFILDKLMAYSAQYMQYLFGIVLLILWFKKGTKEEVLKNRKAGILSLLSFAAAMIINFVVSLIYFEPRPFAGHIVTQLVKHAADASFPSDHAAAAFALAFPVFYANKKFGWFMIAMAVVLSFSRVYVGIHYPFDILIGFIIACIVFYFIKRYSKYPIMIADYVIMVWNACVGMINKQTINWRQNGNN